MQKAATKIDGLRHKVYSALLLFQYYAFVPNLNFSGYYSANATPVPIPNTEVTVSYTHLTLPTMFEV